MTLKEAKERNDFGFGITLSAVNYHREIGKRKCGKNSSFYRDILKTGKGLIAILDIGNIGIRLDLSIEEENEKEISFIPVYIIYSQCSEYDDRHHLIADKWKELDRLPCEPEIDWSCENWKDFLCENLFQKLMYCVHCGKYGNKFAM